ncbi:hypothetical protein NB464_14425 [Vibrio diabolicus]|uniref:hypothetical protein n=1 Tax=Vibrio diabolicus TaxID=50719 RepID=UPI00215C0B37|nr:hypothetical protein [Vibrio diabolicus]MCR9426802.1 hypothetical protein [Vibrio diabolicus]
MSKYQKQIERAERYYERFKKINDGREHDSHSETYFDDIYTFFMHCYHIKDYLKHDASYTTHTNQEIENYITNTPSLALCADICNGLKHLNLNNTRSGDTPDVDSGTIHVNITEGMGSGNTEVKVSCKVTVKHAGSEKDAFELASEAMGSWRTFI